jgi:hypothetical protein
MNQRSPLYNFATVRVLGPLDPEAGRDLAVVPMQRLGVAYADPSLPERIVERTGGYPSFVQLLCDAVLKQLEGGDLVIGEAEVSEAEKGPLVASTLGDIFRLNAGKVAQIAVYGLLEREAITAADVAQSLKSALDRPVSTEELDQALLELRLFGFLVEREGRFTWAIPLLRDTLRASGPEIARARLVDEVRESSS